MIAEWQSLTTRQKHTFVASFLGWMLDAFDFFLMIFVVRAIAADFHTTKTAVSWATTLTLAMRPLGALIFGRLADKYGRKPILMIDIVLFSVFELASAFSPNLTVLIITRVLFGIAMGGEWGLGSSLTMESIPSSARGFASGILQQGYAVGHLFAALVYTLLFTTIGWRGMFMIGVVPALLVLYIRRNVDESPVWREVSARPKVPVGVLLQRHAGLLVYVVLMMTAFNFFSHGTQDAYPTFLQGRGFNEHQVGLLEIISDFGAIIGGTYFGHLSQRIGRRRAIVYAAAIALPVIPVWAFAGNIYLLAVGSFLMRVSVQGAWGVIPVHLNELSPDEVRATFPAFAYQLGNLFASANLTIQTAMASSRGENFSVPLATVAGAAAVAIMLFAGFGRERHSVVFGAADAEPAKLASE
ncbi:MAG TPA: MFS transporter [Gemmatimonadaceae bacterium]|nr:MFS transporter [Gemmatimonadaceae bacterium]